VSYQVFIKFFAPWCGHCQEIAPAWAKLMDEFKDSKTALVGEMDCATAPDDEAFCGELKVDG
jgi:protein disulfide isomerase family A protein 2